MKDRLQGNPDATARAKEFVGFVKKNPNIATNEETMTCWFANAIMTGYDIEKKSLQEEQEAEGQLETQKNGKSPRKQEAEKKVKKCPYCGGVRKLVMTCLGTGEGFGCGE